MHAGQWSIRINDQWRVCLRLKNGDTFDVEITDYHWGERLMSKKSVNAIHPGEFLAEILAELKLSQAALARAIGVSPMRISHLVKGTRPVTAELALLLGRAFDQSPEYWLNLQTRFDLATAEASLGRRLRTVHSVSAA